MYLVHKYMRKRRESLPNSRKLVQASGKLAILSDGDDLPVHFGSGLEHGDPRVALAGQGFCGRAGRTGLLQDMSETGIQRP